MTENGQVLRWPSGEGWLVLSGGADSLGTVRAQVLRKAQPDGGVAYIGLSADDADEIMDDMAELGAPTGYFVDIMAEDDETIRSEIDEAAVIVIPGEFPVETLRSALLGAAIEAMRSAYEKGAVVLAEGRSAALFGAVAVDEGSDVIQGLNWLEGAYIVPGITSISESGEARSALASHAADVVIGIMEGAALALGPSGIVETWGDARVSIGLGSQKSGD